MINRDFYLNQIIKSKWDGQIKVVTGIRRVGKSVLLFELYKEHLINEGVSEENIITISLDQRKYFKYRNPITLCEYVETLINNSKESYYLFIDEVQNVENFEEVLNGFRSEDDYSIFVTGSNSYLLSGELVTKLTGRYIEFEIYTLSFEEYESMKLF